MILGCTPGTCRQELTCPAVTSTTASLVAPTPSLLSSSTMNASRLTGWPGWKLRTVSRGGSRNVTETKRACSFNCRSRRTIATAASISCGVNGSSGWAAVAVISVDMLCCSLLASRKRCLLLVSPARRLHRGKATCEKRRAGDAGSYKQYQVDTNDATPVRQVRRPVRPEPPRDAALLPCPGGPGRRTGLPASRGRKARSRPVRYRPPGSAAMRGTVQRCHRYPEWG